MVERLFLTVPRGCLRFVIVVFPDHTHLLFLTDITNKDNAVVYALQYVERKRELVFTFIMFLMLWSIIFRGYLLWSLVCNSGISV